MEPCATATYTRLSAIASGLPMDEQDCKAMRGDKKTRGRRSVKLGGICVVKIVAADRAINAAQSSMPHPLPQIRSGQRTSRANAPSLIAGPRDGVVSPSNVQ